MLHGWFTALHALLGALSPIAGEYHAPHTVRVVCEGGWCVEETEDVMTITRAGDGTIDVSIELVQTNGHTCGFEGNLAPVPWSNPRWIFHSDDPDTGSCTLILDRSRTEITIAADGCRDYCGVRASLDASFPLPP